MKIRKKKKSNFDIRSSYCELFPHLKEFKEDWVKFSKGRGAEKLQGDST